MIMVRNSFQVFVQLKSFPFLQCIIEIIRMVYFQPNVWISIWKQAMERLVMQKKLFEEYLERVRDEASQSEVVITFVWHKSVLLQKGMIASPCLGCLFPLCALCI